MRSENFCVLIVYSNTLHEIPKGEEEKSVMLFACFTKQKIRGCCWLKLRGTKKNQRPLEPSLLKNSKHHQEVSCNNLCREMNHVQQYLVIS